jgi:hypothetical protein
MEPPVSQDLHLHEREAIAAGRSTARVLTHPAIEAVVVAVVDAARALAVPVPLERVHERGLSSRMLRVLGDRLALACARAPIAVHLDALCLEVGRAAFGDDVDLVRQLAPCLRVNPPRCPELCVPFHTDAWAGNPREQRAIWIPLIDIEADEGLWIADDDVSRSCAAPARLAVVQGVMRASATPVTLRVGEAIIFGADVGHGSVPHEVDRTRWSIDVRVAPASAMVATGWKARALCLS